MPSIRSGAIVLVLASALALSAASSPARSEPISPETVRSILTNQPDHVADYDLVSHGTHAHMRRGIRGDQVMVAYQWRGAPAIEIRDSSGLGYRLRPETRTFSRLPDMFKRFSPALDSLLDAHGGQLLFESKGSGAVAGHATEKIQIKLESEELRRKSVIQVARDLEFLVLKLDQSGWEDAVSYSLSNISLAPPESLFTIPSGYTEAVEEPSAAGKPTKPGSGTSGPPFTWDVIKGSECTPGTSLTLKEVSRLRLSETTVVEYEVHAQGFSAAENPVLVHRLMNEQYMTNPLVVFDDKDLTLLRPNLTVGNYVKGEALELALFTSDGSKHAQARAIPFPINAEGAGPCRASAQAVLVGGQGFALLFEGFEPDERVSIEGQFKEKRTSHSIDRAAEGVFLIVDFDPEDRGEASYTAIGKACSITLKFKVGKDAVVVQ